MIDCSIIVPVHNRASLTRQCLNRLLADATLPHSEIIVIDDASTDGTPELLSGYGNQIRVLVEPVNRGFAEACNYGAAIANGTFLIFLNNDTLPQKGWLENLHNYAVQHPQAAMVGAKLLYPDDTVQHAGVAICEDRYPRHIYAGFPADHPAVCKSRRFQIVTAACALVHRGIFNTLRGFDERYLNGYEDVDFCLRLGAGGYEVHFCHTAVLSHLESATRPLETLPQNLSLYRADWYDRVVPDEFHYYLQDGLIDVNYSPVYPIHLRVSPQLATVQDPARREKLEDLLHLRSLQSSQQRREFLRVIAAWGDMERAQALQGVPHDATRTLPARAGSPGTHLSWTPPAQEITDANFPRTLARPLPATAPARMESQGKIHVLASELSSPLYSVLMPVKNGAQFLSETLPRILQQKVKGRVEMIAVDSGSSDDTIRVLKEYGATILAIPPTAFNHGLTRNLLANHAHGSVFVFLNQSALPTDELWLANLVAPLEQDAELAGVCSRLVPRVNADVLVQRDVMRDPSSLDTSRVSRLTDWRAYRALAPDALRDFINFHSISAAIRPEVLQRIPFPSVLLIGEDLTWAKQVLEAGYPLRHEASSVVFHSHSYSYTELAQRNFDDAVLNRALVGRVIDAAQVMPGILAALDEDWRYIEQQGGLDAAGRASLRTEAVMRRTAQWVGQYLGGHLDELPNGALDHFALTESIKNRVD